MRRRGGAPLAFFLDHVGPMTRTVRDNALMLQVIAGHDPGDPGSTDEPVPDYGAMLGQNVRGLRSASSGISTRGTSPATPNRSRDSN